MLFAKRLKESFFILGCLAVGYFLLALASYAPEDPGWSYVGEREQAENLAGAAGAWTASVLLSLFGLNAYLVLGLLMWMAWVGFRERHSTIDQSLGWARWSGFLLIIPAVSALMDLHIQVDHLPEGAGGILGTGLLNFGVGYFNVAGAALLFLAMASIGLTLFTGLSWLMMIDALGELVLKAFRRLKSLVSAFHPSTLYKVENRPVESRKKPRKRTEKKTPPLIEAPKPESESEVKPKSKPRVAKRVQQQTVHASSAVEPMDNLPSLDFLDPPQPNPEQLSEAELQAMSAQVERKLADFSITAEVVAVHPGPVVTMFELQLAPGTKASKVTNLAKDLARALLVVSVRVVEVIPGKSVIGLEIPNPKREMVYLSEILCSASYTTSQSPLTLSLGKDIVGEPVVADLAKMPHALIAGTTGSGKSVAINTMILSLLYKSTARQVRLIMIDPKMLELSVYEGIPHLLTPVVTDMDEAANALRWCVAEMERRYRLMAALGVRNINGYNKKIAAAEKAGEPLPDPLFIAEPNPITGELPEMRYLDDLPYIVIVIDELADMMMVVGKKVEELIARLAQKARAAGIHLLLATQRPSVDVITGLIKANIPTRIAFQVSSRVDSRTILDQMGAEHLLGHGDMLFLPSGTSIPQRAHGAFVDDHEVHRVVDFLKQLGQPDYVDEILQESSEVIPGLSAEASGVTLNTEDSDPLFDEAVKIITESRRASVSGVQRRLKIGYNRAARLVEEMERIGIVSQPDHKGNREVMAPPPVGD